MTRNEAAPFAFATMLFAMICAAPAQAASHSAAESPQDCATQQSLRIAGANIRLLFDARDFALSPTQICAWVEHSALAVGSYFERFPVRAVRVVMEPVDSARVVTGTTYGSAEGGPLIVIKLGSRAEQASLDHDWVMTHEFVHLAVPSVPVRSHWLEEGIATYVEPIARVQLGQLAETKVWNDMLRDMPQGLPRSGDQGLDRTPTWGRTYWGGALFCLLADVEIRKRSNNHLSLRDALRGVLKAGGNIERDWTAEKIFASGDKAIGMTVLSDLYRKMATTPGLAELDGLWQMLGVSRVDDEVSFSANAPLATVRAAMTAPAPQSPGRHPS